MIQTATVTTSRPSKRAIKKGASMFSPLVWYGAAKVAFVRV